MLSQSVSANASSQRIEDGVPAVVQPAASHARSRNCAFYLLCVFPVINALVDASRAALGMQDEDLALAYSCIAFTFFSYLSIHAKFTLEGMQESYDFVAHRRIPEDLKTISTGKKVAAISVATAVTAYVTFSDSVAAYFYTDSIPAEYEFDSNPTAVKAWIAPTVIATAGIAIVTLTSEIATNYRYMHELLAGGSVDYANTASRIASPIAGHVLGAISGIDDMLGMVVSMAVVLGAKNVGAVIGITLLSLINGASEYALTSQFIRDSINSAFRIGSQRCFTPTEVLSGIATIGTCGYFVSVTTHATAEQLIKDLSEILDTPISDEAKVAFNVLTWADAVSDTAIFTASLYPFVNAGLQKLVDFLGKQCRCCPRNGDASGLAQNSLFRRLRDMTSSSPVVGAEALSP